MYEMFYSLSKLYILVGGVGLTDLNVSNTLFFLNLDLDPFFSVKKLWVKNMSNYFVILVTGGVWQRDGDNSNYVREYVKNYGLNLPPNFNLSMLLQIVRNKTGFSNNQIFLSFKHQSGGTLYILAMNQIYVN